jgi:formate/nitrite transporter FocA (FNT family)
MFNLLFGAYGFPVGLSMCVINGASLFTSNIAYMTASFMERKSTAWQSLRVVWLSYFSNLVGKWLCSAALLTAQFRCPFKVCSCRGSIVAVCSSISRFTLHAHPTVLVNTHLLLWHVPYT